jgi:hypothetical protein
MIVLPLTLGAMVLLLVGRFGSAGLLRLTTLQFRGGLLALSASVVQAASVLLLNHRLVMLLVTMALLLGFCWLNRTISGFWLVTLGISLNLLVMFANSGHMPISPAAFQRMSGLDVPGGTFLLFSKDRVLEDAAAMLPWLGDRLFLPGPLAGVAVWSVGDVLLLTGTGQLLWVTMKGKDHAQSNLRRGTASC